MDPHWKAIPIDFIGNVLFAFLLYLYAKIKSYLSRRRFLTLAPFFILLFLWYTLNIFVLSNLRNYSHSMIIVLIVPLLLFAMLIILLWIEFGNTRLIGISGVDKQCT